MTRDTEIHPDRWVRHGDDLAVQGETARGAGRNLGSLVVDPGAWGNDVAAEAVARWAGDNADRWAVIGSTSESTGALTLDGAAAYVETDTAAAHGVASSIAPLDGGDR
ncbi:MAG: hypothetical protein ACRCSN_13165 [Dermatophilaceae bacterium]